MQPRKSRTFISDRFLHDFCNEILVGRKDSRKDTILDEMAKVHGSKHREFFPHRTVTEAAMYICMDDISKGKKPDILQSMMLANSHFMVDKMDSKMKEKLGLFKALSELL